MKITTKICDEWGYASQCGFNQDETIKDYVDDVVRVLDYLDVGDCAEICRLNPSESARDSILEDIYVEILVHHTKYINNIFGTKGQKWMYALSMVDEDEQTMFEKKSLMVKRIK